MALLQLNGVAQKVKFRGLKQRAAELMEAIAQDRGFSRAQLEDRIVPDCGLDERGSRELNFGSRKFFVVLGDNLKPLVKDESGKLRTDLPAPGAKDDVALAEAAVAEWRLLKKQLREVSKVQVTRLEHAMVTRRRWKVEDFLTLLVRHPLMINLIRLNVWATFDSLGALKDTFRVTPEQDFADINDRQLLLNPTDRVGIPHMLELNSQLVQKWQRVFSDYEIVPPFAQLDRPVFRLDPAELNANSLTRYVDKVVPAAIVVGSLERRGWAHGPAQDNGDYREHIKVFHELGITAVLQYDGINVSGPENWEDQNLDACYFAKGTFAPNGSYWGAPKMKLSDVDAVVLSEVISDHELLMQKVAQAQEDDEEDDE